MTPADLPKHIREINPGMAAEKRLPQPRCMNKTEVEYARRLNLQRGVQSVEWEAVRLRIGAGAWYTPDFLVVRDGRMELHEVKGGFVREAARVRYRVAVMKYPWFVWVWAQKTAGGWKIERARNESLG